MNTPDSTNPEMTAEEAAEIVLGMTAKELRRIATGKLGGPQRAHKKTRAKVIHGKTIISKREMGRQNSDSSPEFTRN